MYLPRPLYDKFNRTMPEGCKVSHMLDVLGWMASSAEHGHLFVDAWPSAGACGEPEKTYVIPEGLTLAQHKRVHDHRTDDEIERVRKSIWDSFKVFVPVDVSVRPHNPKVLHLPVEVDEAWLVANGASGAPGWKSAGHVDT